jgi:zinc protease
VYGILPNGMKYALRRNETPQGAASVRLTIDAGRMAEIEGEQGLAHFLEHMAFRGSAKIPDGELLKKLERLGLAFGPDTNAETGPDYTRYKLDLPRTDADMIDAALLIMRETASELTLSPEAIDKERGVILAEAPTRDSPGIRNLQAYLNNAVPQSNAGKGVFTDDQTDVQNAPAATVRRFYERTYRPENATLVLVGDFDVAAVEAKIKAQFSDWRGKGTGASNTIGTVEAEPPLRFGNFAHPGAVEAVELVRVEPLEPVENTVEGVREGILSQLWETALAQRLDRLSRAPDSKVAAALTGASPLFRALYNLSVSVIVKDGDWQSALRFGEQEYRRMAEFGLGQDELDLALQKLTAEYESAVQTNASWPNDYLATNISDNALNATYSVTPADYLAILNAYKGSITPELVHAAFKREWDGGVNYLHVASKQPIANFAKVAAATLEESRSVAVAPLVAAKAAQFAYTDFGKPGKIAKDTRNAELGLRMLTFKNGVMLNIKKTDFEPGNIQFAVRIGSGLSGQKGMIAGQPFFMDQTSGMDGLAAHSYDELQSIIAGRRVKLGLSARQRDIASLGSVAPQDLAFQMQLIAATVTAYGYRSETDQSWKSIANVVEDQLRASPMGAFQSKVFSILAGDDSRLGIADVDGLSERTMAELKGWLQAELDSGPIEISLVGDVEEAAAIDAIAKTFGALPKRGQAKPIDGIAFPQDRTLRTVTHMGKDDQAMLLLNWPTPDDSDQRDMAARDLLAGVLQNEMRAVLREKLGATYTPEALSIPSNAFPGYGFLLALVTTPPENMDRVKTELLAIVARLRDEGTTEDALLRVRQPIIERFAAQERQNSSWLNSISEAQSRPERLGRRAKRAEIWSSITPADIQKAAQTYLLPDTALEIRIVSEAVAAAAKAE